MLERLRAIVGDDGLLPADDFAIHGVAPGAVVAPASAEQAAEVLALASAEGWAVEPAGAGRWLGAGRPPADPSRAAIVLSSRRLHDVDEYEPADLTACVGAGASLEALGEHFAGNGQWLPLDPPGGEAGTLGAAVATASAGPLRAGFGTPRDLVLGLRLVTGDGRILDFGGRVVKNVAGYDLVKLVVGSRGTLGFVARVNVRLYARPAADRTLALGCASADAALAVAAAVRESRAEPAALELLSPGLAQRAVGAARWTVLARLLGGVERVEDGASRIGDAARAAAGAAEITGSEVAEAPADAWTALARAEAEAALVVRLAGRAGDLPATLARGAELAARLVEPGAAATGADGPVRGDVLARAGSGAGVVVHAADGIVRLLLDVPAAGGRGSAAGRGPATAPAPSATGDDSAWLAAAAGGVAAARADQAAAGGTVLVARAPAALAARVDPFGPVGPALDLMRGLKSIFDPAGVLAPGRFVV